jgi:SAM-dependent methyltransferase
MEDERHTERLYRKIDSFLKWTGLYRAAKGIAGVRHTVGDVPAAMSGDRESRDASHFQRLYDASPDPWKFRTSAYEQSKYQTTIASLGTRRFRSGFEAGCSIGVLTRLLAERCDRLLAVDIVGAPLSDARKACADQLWVRFEQKQVPDEWPDECFDLIVLSEVLYFLSPTDIAKVADRVCATLDAKGVVLLVNWRGRSRLRSGRRLTNRNRGDPCTGDEAAGIFIDRAQRWLTARTQHVEDAYRLDLLCRRS